MIRLRDWRLPIAAAIFAAAASLVLGLLDQQLARSADPRFAIAAAFRSGALSIDPVADWRIGTRRGADCAYLQGGLSSTREPGLPFGLWRFTDPRDLAEDCEILRDLAVRDPIAQYEASQAGEEIALGHGLVATLLGWVSLDQLRWAVIGLWAASLMGGWLLGRPRHADAPETFDRLFAPMLALACVWIIGPSISAALPVAILLGISAWIGYAAIGRDGTRLTVASAALCGALLALTQFRAPVVWCGLAVIVIFVLRRSSLKSGWQIVAAYILAALFGNLACDVLAAIGQDSPAMSVAQRVLDRMDLVAVPMTASAAIDAVIGALDTALPGPRSWALGMLLGVVFGLIFSPALTRATQAWPTSAGRGYAHVVGVCVLAVWIFCFGGLSGLRLGEGGMLYAWMVAAAAAATSDWLGTAASRGFALVFRARRSTA